jgi:hypothetical protein
LQRKCTRLQLERLEDRTLPSLSPTAWTPIGPAPINDPTGANEPASGRITAIAADPGNANIIYVGAAGGGVWKTQDGGQTWNPLTDAQPTLFIGSIAVAPSNSQIIYAGTGEANNAGDSFYGRGILKSTNAGSTWTLLPGFQDANHPDAFDRRVISKIAVDPGNPDIVYAAVAQGGNVLLPSGAVTSVPGAVNGLVGNAGVWKSTDGGADWTNTTTAIANQFLAPDGTSNEGFTDLVIDPSNSNTLYTAIGTLNGSPAGGVYLTTTAGDVPAGGGAAWVAAGNFPQGFQDGRISLAIAPSATQTLYAAVSVPGVPPPNTPGALQGTLSQMLTTTNAGATANWTQLANTPQYMNSLGYYANALAVNPNNANNVFAAGGVNGLIETTDGGATWTNIAQTAANGPHVDHHALAFNQNNQLLDGNDGGIWLLNDPSTNSPSWTDINGNLQITEFNTVALDPNDPTKIFAASQDNGLSFSSSFLSSPQWNLQVGGDGGFVRADPFQENTFYFAPSTANAPIFQMTTNEGGNWSGQTGTGTQTLNVNNQGFLQDNARFYPPFVVDQNTAGRILFASNRIYETTDRGNTWKAISTPLSGNWDTNAPIDSVAIAPTDSKTIYATANGEIFVTTDDGTTWTKRTIPGATDHFSQLVVDPADSRFVFAVRDRFNDPANNNVGHVFRSGDGGATWNDITGDLPDLPTNCLLIDSQDSTIYVGTDSGVFSTLQNSNLWNAFPGPTTGSLPNVRVMDLQLDTVHNILAAATYGRGIWEIQKFPNLQVSVADQEGTEGQTPSNIPLLATFQDPSGPDLLTLFFQSVTIDWGDNTQSTISGLSGLIQPDATFANQFDVFAAHTYAEDGVFPITVTVNDPDGSAGSSMGRATIADAGLSATANAVASAVEGASIGGQLASFTDSDPGAVATADNPNGNLADYSATIDWGDGSTDQGTITATAGTSTYAVSGTHAYAEDGNHQAQITVADQGGAVTQIAVPLTVTDAALSGNTVPATAVEGASSSVNIASFTDADPNAQITDANPQGNLSDYSATIDWGDNSGTTTGTVVADPATGTYLVNASHAYAEEGTYTPQITITDVGGASIVVPGTVIVSDAALTGFPRSASIPKGQTFAGTLIYFSDADPASQFSIFLGGGNAQDYSATIDWGDGHQEPGTIIPDIRTGNYEVVGMHAYAPGQWSPTVTVSDVGGSIAVDSFTITVGELTTLSLSSSANPSKLGQAVTLTATVSPVNSGAGNPNGSVTFMDGSTVLGSQPLQLVNGLMQATTTTTDLPAGFQSITAFYDGNDPVFDATDNVLHPLRQLVQSPPIIQSLSITSNDPDGAVTLDSILTANVTGFDPNGESISYAYQWSQNGTDLAGAASSTLDLSQVAGAKSGDTIGVTVTPSDASYKGMPMSTSVIINANLGDWLWTRQFGSPQPDAAYAVSADESGAYVAGHTAGRVSGGDIYLSKYDPLGNVLWTRQFGSGSDDKATAVFVYASAVYVAGYTGPTAAGNDQLGFVAKYDALGSLVWSREFAIAPQGTLVHAVSADSSGVYVAGEAGTLGAGEPVGPPFGAGGGGGLGSGLGGIGPPAVVYHAFIIKYDTNGGQLWTRQFGTSPEDAVQGAFADGTGVYVCGNTSGTLSGQASAGGDDAFLAKYDAAGNLVWTDQFGSPGADAALGVSANSTGVYVAGFAGAPLSEFAGTALAGPAPAGNFAAFLVKVDFNGNLLWNSQFGAADSDSANAVSTDGSAVYVAGQTGAARVGAFLAKFDNSGNLLGTRHFNSALEDDAYGVSVAGPSVYVAGSTNGPLGDQMQSGPIDSFLLKCANSGNNIRPVITSVTISSSGPHGAVTAASVLTANVVGDDPDGEVVSYEYQWSRNGVVIAGAAGSTLDLSLQNVQRGDVITVTVTPTDPTAAGTPVSASVVASFVADPASQSVDVGQRVTFTSAYADPAFKVHWQLSKDGGSTYRNIRGATGDTFVLKATLAESGMLFRAVFDSGAVAVFSNSAILQVNPRPSIGNLSLDRGTVGNTYDATLSIAGGIAPFTLGLASGLPPGVGQPSLTEVSLPAMKGLTDAAAFTITLTGTPTMAGIFHGSVKLTDSTGTSVTKVFTITIAANDAGGHKLLALTEDGHLLTFTSAAPDKITNSVVVTGLAKGDVLHNLVYTPQGTLYGIGGNPGSFEVTFDRLYTINPATGVATPGASLGTGLFSLDGVLGASFDPVSLQLRAIDDSGHNDLIDPAKGTVTRTGKTPSFVPGDPNQRVGLFFFSAVAYTNEVAAAASATLYGIAVSPIAGSFLVTLGGPDGNPSPDKGQTHTVFATQPIFAFAIAGPDNTAYAIESAGHRVELWTVNLANGSESNLGGIGSARTIVSLAVIPA